MYVRIWKPKFMIHNIAMSQAMSSGFNWTNCMTNRAKGLGRMWICWIISAEKE